MSTLLTLRPALHRFDTCAEFAAEYGLGEGDLILTNAYLYEPCFGPLDLRARVLYQERYGLGEPTDVMADAILDELDGMDCRRVIAIGGGTILDLAKLLAVAGKERVDDLYAAAPGLTKRRALVLVPTTCGTGSEVTNLSILSRTRLGTKLGLVSDQMYADSAVLIPELLEGLPYPVFAASSIDALVHAVESFLSPKATDYTRLFGRRAIELIVAGYQRIAEEGPEARIPLLGDFLTASNFAGIAFGTAGCAAVHAMSYPLGATYHVAHGESNYALFTGVLRKYFELRQDGALAALNALLSGLLGCAEAEVYPALERLLEHILPHKPLRAYGVTEADLAEFTQAVLTAQGRLMANNFVPLDGDQVRSIYQALY